MYNIIWKLIGRHVMVNIVMAAREVGIVDDDMCKLLISASKYYRKEKTDYVIYFMCARDNVSTTNTTNKAN